MKKVLPFIIAGDHSPTRLGLDDEALRARFLPPLKQVELDFGVPTQNGTMDIESVRSGEL
jgi:hypothetical protein